MGIDDQEFTDLIARNNINVRLATLDTGRLFPKSYSLLDRTRAKYDIDIKCYFPDTITLEEFVNENGMNSIYNSFECRTTRCKVRKIDRLFRALDGAVIWVTSIRADQSENKTFLPRTEKDAFTGLVKFNPLVDWNDLQLYSYINSHSVPSNTLHRKGCPSIGCEPCTRAITEEDHPRAGRRWGEISSQECGLQKVDSCLSP